MRFIKTLVVVLGAFIGLTAANAALADDNLTGGFTNVAMKTSGTWRIESRADGHYAVLAEDFSARKAPDLKIFLSKLPSDDIDDDNAGEGVFVAELKSHKGAQEYRLPDGLNLDEFQSFVIHCEKYSKFWASGSLR